MRITADIDIREFLLQFAQTCGNRAFGEVDVERAGHSGVATGEAGFQVIKHRLHDARDARQHIHILHLESRRGADGIVNQRCPFWGFSHFQAGFIDVFRRIMRAQAALGFRVTDERCAESLGDAGSGNVVMRRADAAGGEDVGVGGAAFIHRVDDGLLDIGDDAGMGHPDAQRVQLARKPAQVFVLRPAGEDLVADDDETGGGGVVHRGQDRGKNAKFQRQYSGFSINFTGNGIALWEWLVYICFMAKEITIHTPEDYEGMRKAGRLAATILDEVAELIRPGVSTNAINDYCHDRIIKAGAIPAPLNYRGFPKSICTSINHVVCHGIPDANPLKNGDAVNVDVTVIVDGWHGDTSRMFWVGDAVPIKAKRLTQITYEAMMLGIEQVKPGATTGDIGYAIQTYAERQGYSIVKDYCGHGLGKVFHAAPNILHYGTPGSGVKLQEGMFFTVEPMVNAGKEHTKLSTLDGWTVTTRDRSLSCQFEHSIAVTKDGFEIFTASPSGRHCPPYV